MEKKATAKNGIVVYHERNQSLHGFSLCLYLKAGLLYEKREEAGITHFFEHAAIRNLNKRMNGELYSFLDRNGLYFNAVTYREFVQFSLSGAAENFSIAAPLAIRLLEPFILTADEISTECKRIKAEIREEQERETVDYLAKKEIWKNTSLEGMITGTAGSVSKIGKQALCRIRKQLLVPENLFFYITGNVSPKQLKIFCRDLGQIKLFDGPQRENRAPVPETFFHRNGTVVSKNGEGCRIQVCFDADLAQTTREVRNLLYDCLFSGDSCGMFQELSEKKGYIYSYDATFEEYRNIGNLSFAFEAKRQNLIPALAAAARLLAEAKHSVPRLDIVRTHYTDNGRLILDDADSLNWQRAYEGHILGEPYRSATQRIEAYRQVRQEQVTALARKIFRIENLLIVYRGKKQAYTPEQWKELFQTELQ